MVWIVWIVLHEILNEMQLAYIMKYYELRLFIISLRIIKCKNSVISKIILYMNVLRSKCQNFKIVILSITI